MGKKVKNKKLTKKQKIRLQKLKRRRQLFFIVLVIIILTIIVQTRKNKTVEVSTTLNSEVIKMAERTPAKVNKYTVYGTHLNISTTLELPETEQQNIQDVKIVLKKDKNNEIEQKATYKKETNQIIVETSTYINEGIDLEKIQNSNYYILLKTTTQTETKYYKLENSTEYNNVEYYTLTKNGKNQKIDIKFEDNTHYMCMNVNDTKLPENVYDVAIDPGHGGADGGCFSGEYTEEKLALKVGNSVKEELEKLGLKVLMTRDSSLDPNEQTAITMYDENGRVNMVGNSKAKIALSLHLNSTETGYQHGVEVYGAAYENLDFAKSLADNIVETAHVSYSGAENHLIKKGVYVRTLTETELAEMKATAKSKNYTPYNADTDTAYFFMIRECGGICTNAYVDGRNKSFGTNKYYNSNIGVETYLLELGYIDNAKDRSVMINNPNLYAQGIAKAISSQYLNK